MENGSKQMIDADHIVKQFEEADSNHNRIEKLGVWASRWGDTILNDWQQLRAIQKAVNGLDADELRNVARMLRARAYEIDPQDGDVEATMAALVAEAQSDDVIVAVGRLLGRAVTYKDCYGDVG